MIHYREGDLFTSSADALAHGCNAMGRMGAGIAAEFKDLFPDMYSDYRSRARQGSLTPGEGYMYQNSTRPHVINLITQFDGPANILDVRDCFVWLEDSYHSLGIRSVAMPRIGAGLGKLEWDYVNVALKEVFDSSTLIVEVWSLDI